MTWVKGIMEPMDKENKVIERTKVTHEVIEWRDQEYKIDVVSHRITYPKRDEMVNKLEEELCEKVIVVKVGGDLDPESVEVRGSLCYDSGLLYSTDAFLLDDEVEQTEPDKVSSPCDMEFDHTITSPIISQGAICLPDWFHIGAHLRIGETDPIYEVKEINIEGGFWKAEELGGDLGKYPLDEVKEYWGPVMHEEFQESGEFPRKDVEFQESGEFQSAACSWFDEDDPYMNEELCKVMATQGDVTSNGDLILQSKGGTSGNLILRPGLFDSADDDPQTFIYCPELDDILEEYEEDLSEATNVCVKCKEKYEYAEKEVDFECWGCRSGY
jgi:hypothetical protein